MKAWVVCVCIMTALAPDSADADSFGWAVEGFARALENLNGIPLFAVEMLKNEPVKSRDFTHKKSVRPKAEETERSPKKSPLTYERIEFDFTEKKGVTDSWIEHGFVNQYGPDLAEELR